MKTGFFVVFLWCDSSATYESMGHSFFGVCCRADCWMGWWMVIIGRSMGDIVVAWSKALTSPLCWSDIGLIVHSVGGGSFHVLIDFVHLDVEIYDVFPVSVMNMPFAVRIRRRRALWWLSVPVSVCPNLVLGRTRRTQRSLGGIYPIWFRATFQSGSPAVVSSGFGLECTLSG